MQLACGYPVSKCQISDLHLNPDGVNPESMMTHPCLRGKPKATKLWSPMSPLPWLLSQGKSLVGLFHSQLKTNTTIFRSTTSLSLWRAGLCVFLTTLTNWCMGPAGFRRQWLHVGSQPQRGKGCHCTERSFPKLQSFTTFPAFNIFAVATWYLCYLPNIFSFTQFSVTYTCSRKLNNHSSKWKTSIPCHK